MPLSKCILNSYRMTGPVTSIGQWSYFTYLIYLYWTKSNVLYCKKLNSIKFWYNYLFINYISKRHKIFFKWHKHFDLTEWTERRRLDEIKRSNANQCIFLLFFFYLCLSLSLYAYRLSCSLAYFCVWELWCPVIRWYHI